jgi:hypothetical protein
MRQWEYVEAKHQWELAIYRYNTTRSAWDRTVGGWITDELVSIQAGVTDAEVQAAAEVLYRDYESEYSAGHLTWRDFTDPARRVLAAAREALARPGDDEPEDEDDDLAVRVRAVIARYKDDQVNALTAFADIMDAVGKAHGPATP